MRKDGYYECDKCPRWFKVVDGKEIELKMPRDIQEILSHNIILLKKGECKHVKLRNDIKVSKSHYRQRRSLQDFSRYHSFI
jgi:hypothetical protein